jgi:hypothetical protein
MFASNFFALALQAYRELQPELACTCAPVPRSGREPAGARRPAHVQAGTSEQAGQSAHVPALPALEDVLEKLESLPQDALMLGVASDGLPVLLDLHDPAPCPILVVGDDGSGKTALLQLLARTTDLLQNPGDVQFGVVTNFPDEWSSLEASPASMGIWPAYHNSAVKFIHDMVTWADSSTHGRQISLLLLDDLASLVNTNYDTQEDLRWLLVRGPERRVWTVATLNAVRAVRLRPWLNLFRTHIFGFIHQPALAETLTGDPQAILADLAPGLQFSLKQETGWLQFWAPTMVADCATIIDG